MANKIMLVVFVLCALLFWNNTKKEKAENQSQGITSSDTYEIQRIFSSVVNKQGKPVAKHNMEKRGYIMVYYSASWCPPCRQFTPVLNKYYLENRVKKNFDVLLVGADRSEKAMLSYMSHMSFNAIAFDKIASSGLHNYAARSIPNLTVFDYSGKVVVDGRELSAYKALDAFKKLPVLAGGSGYVR
ncbi:thioredoxin-like domain-containing protein [Lentisphaera profundi]|uniref:Thioredoxin-like domain-containing protein n=1 Tax=Lentisphaera profundi TaxID=1658616 RepID=A0ABY7VYV4_9BACT|nr:thioredoxin-like domain-containing protein [Lentisphaera profundi]WDE99287.1 thioredoxin-like domain-containing protein [Lentisphaera profundi]